MDHERQQVAGAERERSVQELAAEYRAAYKDYWQMSRPILNEQEFEQLFAQEGERIEAHAAPLEDSTIKLWKYYEKEGLMERFHYPESENNDLIHATNWGRIASAVAEPLKLLKATGAEFGDGIWHLGRREAGGRCGYALRSPLRPWQVARERRFSGSGAYSQLSP